MPDRHRSAPLSIRLPDAERQRLQDRAERDGKPVRRIIIDAITRELDRLDAEDAPGVTNA